MLKPEIIDSSNVQRIETLQRSVSLLNIIDRLDIQVFDFIEQEHPGESEATVFEKVEAQLPLFKEESVWVYYPWSNNLVRVLPEGKFYIVRTNRNKYKISPAEQETINNTCIGIAGLSAGFSVAINFALESVGSHFVLADPDFLSLANTNRLQTNIAELGLCKAELAARRMWELNPYLDISVLTNGVVLENLEEFFKPIFRDGTVKELDLVIEECDSMEIKFGIRYEAKRRRIPVVMDTTERGMLDIERFDCEPTRPIFHGLVESLDLKAIRGLSTSQKIPYLLDIIEADGISARKKISLIETESTITGFSQLGSDTTLGGAIAASAARRILLGKHCPSGRYNVDLNEHLKQGRFVDAVVSVPPRKIREQPLGAELKPTLTLQSSRKDIVHYLVAAGTRAPSGANCQPWDFKCDSKKGDGKKSLSLHLNYERGKTHLDPNFHASILALGAAFENIQQLADCLNIAVALKETNHSECYWHFDLTFNGELSTESIERANNHPLWRRACNRNLTQPKPISVNELDAILGKHDKEQLQVHKICGLEKLKELGDIVGLLEGERFLNDSLYQEMMSEIRWNVDDEPKRTGIGTWTLGLNQGEQRSLALVKDKEAIQEARSLVLRNGLGKRSRECIETSSAVIILSCQKNNIQSVFEAGRYLENNWIKLTALGLAAQPITAGLYMLERANTEPSFFDEAQLIRLKELNKRLRQCLDLNPTSLNIMLLRIVKDPAPNPESPRLELKDVSEGVIE